MIYRDTKGSGLTNAEIDANFRELYARAGQAGMFFAEAYGFGANKSYSQNAAALTQAQTDADNFGYGTVVLPAGTFNCDAITWKPRVAFLGAGWKATTINCPIGAYLLNYNTNTIVEGVGSIEKIGFFGGPVDSTGSPTNNITSANSSRGVLKTTGQIANFKFQRLRMLGFSDYAIDLDAALIGDFTECWFRQTNYGIRNVGRSGDLANLVNVVGCWNQEVRYLGIRWERGSSLYIDKTDFETCGQNGDDNTGLVHLYDPSPLNEPIALVFSSRYTENNGGVGVKVVGGNGSTKVVLRDAANWNYAGQRNQSINHVKATGNGTGKLTVVLENSDQGGASGPDVLAIGTVAVVNMLSALGSHQELNGATYQEMMLGAAGTGSTTPGNTAPAPLNTRYKTIVTNANPLYYNYLEAAGTNQPAQVGGTAMTISGTSTQQQPGPFNTRDSSSLAVAFVNDGLIALPIDLSSYNTVAFEFYALTGGSDSSPNGGGLIEYGVPNWGNKTGDFVFTPFSQGTELSIFGFRDNRTGGAGSDQRVPRFGYGWAHIALVITNGTLTRFLLNGISQPITTSAASPSLAFANDTLRFFTGQEPGSLAHLAIYAGADQFAVPSDSVFISHYKAGQ